MYLDTGINGKGGDIPGQAWTLNTDGNRGGGAVGGINGRYSVEIKFGPVQTVPSFSLALILFSSAAAVDQFWKMLAIYNHCPKLL